MQKHLNRSRCLEMTDPEAGLLWSWKIAERPSIFFLCKRFLPGVQRVHGRTAAMLQALPGICDSAPKPEKGI